MKKILVLLLTCAHFAGYAQAPANALWQRLDPVSLSGDTPTGATNMFTITSTSQDRALISFTDKKSLRAWLFSKNHHIDHQYAIDLPETNVRVLSGFIKNDKAILFLSKGNSEKIYTFLFYLDQDHAETGKTELEFNNETYIGGVNCGDHFAYLTVQKKSPVINVYDFKGPQDYVKKSFDFSLEEIGHAFDNSELYEALTQTISANEKDDYANLVDYNLENDPYTLKQPHKLYYRNDTIFLLIDNELNNTQALLIDVKNFKHDYKFLSRSNELCTDPDQSGFNSFLLENKLFYIEACRDVFMVSIFDFATEKLLEKFTVARDGEINFKNTLIIQSGSDDSKRSEKALDKTKQFVRKMLVGKPVIGAWVNPNGLIQMTVGSYYWRTPTYVVSTAPGVSPTYTNKGIQPQIITNNRERWDNRESWEVSSRFTSLLDPVTLEWIDGPVEKTAAEKVFNFTGHRKMSSEADTFFRLGTAYYYSYYNSEAQQIDFVKL